MNWPAYPEYKDSGFSWFAQVPIHWSVTRLKWQLIRNDGGVWGEDPVDETAVPVLRSTDQTVDGRWKISEPAMRTLTPKETAVAKLKAGDLLVTKSSGSSLHIGKTTLVTERIEKQGCCYSNFMQRLRAKKKLLPRIIWYVMNSPLGRRQLDVLSNSTTGLANLNGSIIGDLAVPVAPKGEQQRISEFLNYETARIDALIEEQQHLIDLLQEKRQAVISHAVTKGLDPYVPMKDSGLELLGEIPEHWSVKRLKHIAPFITVGIVVNPSSYVAETGLPFIYGGEVREGTIDVDRARAISVEDSIKNKKTILEARDLVTVRVGYPGLTAVVPEQCEGGNCASVMLIKRGNYDSSWLCNVMNSRIVRHQIDLVQYGAAQKQFNISDAVEFLIFTPPLDEQKEIGAFIERECSKLDYLANTAEEMKGFLQEHRSALISSAVTGKIDVRGWKPQDSPVEHDLPMAAEAEAQYG